MTVELAPVKTFFYVIFFFFLTDAAHAIFLKHNISTKTHRRGWCGIFVAEQSIDGEGGRCAAEPHDGVRWARDVQRRRGQATDAPRPGFWSPKAINFLLDLLSLNGMSLNTLQHSAYVYMWLCVYICEYICVCTCVYVYMCICIYVYAYMCIYVYMCICVHVYIYTCMYVCIHIYKKTIYFFWVLLNWMGTFCDFSGGIQRECNVACTESVEKVTPPGEGYHHFWELYCFTSILSIFNVVHVWCVAQPPISTDTTGIPMGGGWGVGGLTPPPPYSLPLSDCICTRGGLELKKIE